MSKNKLKEKAVLNDEQAEIRRFIIILVTLIVIIIFIFVFTRYAINDGDINIPGQSSNIGQVDNSVVSVGTMFNKEEDEYYVIAFDSSDESNVYYSIISSNYIESQTDEPLYFLDLDNEINSAYRATEDRLENIDAKTIEDISLGEITLIKFKNNKIEEYYNSKESITEVLSVNKD